MSEIKDCRRCGSAEVHVEPDYADEAYLVRCAMCGKLGPRWEDDEDKAVAAWNAEAQSND